MALLKSRCRYPELRWSIGTARLFPEWIQLTGWHAGGRYRRQILVSEIEAVVWQMTPPGAANLFILLCNGEQVCIRVRGAAIWKFALDGKLHRQSKRPVPDESAGGAPYIHRRVYRRGSAAAGEKSASEACFLIAAETT